MIAWHMGALHAYEKFLTFGLAFGPFVLLAIVLFVRRRQDLAELEAEESTGTELACTEPKGAESTGTEVRSTESAPAGTDSEGTPRASQRANHS